jgi:hypothetical protein
VNRPAESVAAPARFAWRTGLALLPLVWGCAPLSPARPVSLSAAVRNEFYARATAEFAEAWLIKPAAETSTNSLMTRFAPLLIQDATPSRSVADTNRSVGFRLDAVVIAGRAHVQLTYAWRGPEAGEARPGVAESEQGVRITLDAAGQPVIWEILTGRSGAKVLFVSQSLEAAAAAEFGRPLPGRRFSVERSLGDAPNAVVARVIEDGPMPMGPMIYLRADRREVSAIACRCMPLQARRLIGDQRYELVVMKASDPGGSPAAGRRQRASTRLEEQLRLPAGF